MYIGQKGDALADIPRENPDIDEVFAVRAGKFRRYHGAGWRQLLDGATVVKNIRDAWWVMIGIWQSFRLLGTIKPDVIFTRGGFVSVPVALAGALRHIPYVTHDSDSTPSLANRLIARWARVHAVALPKELYPYPTAKTVTTGVPISKDYVPVSPELMQRYRRDIGLNEAAQVVLVTGGGNGADALNRTVANNAASLLRRYPRLHIVHIAGRALESQVAAAYDTLLPPDDRKRVVVKGFTTDLYRYSGAADVVIARGGATNLAEFAAQGKACIIIPSSQLVWNIKNTEVLAKRQAVIQLNKDQAEQNQRLAQVVGTLLDDSLKRQQLATELATLARPQATADLAALLLTIPETPKP